MRMIKKVMRKIWEVDFNVIGPLTLEREVQFKQEKGIRSTTIL